MIGYGLGVSGHIHYKPLPNVIQQGSIVLQHRSFRVKGLGVPVITEPIPISIINQPIL